jgi:hypothetical protein
MMKNPRFTEDGGIVVEQPDGIELYVFEGDIYQQAKQGAFGPVAEFVPYVPTEEEKAAAIRAERDALLAATDWTQLPDVPESIRNAYAVYRQALRDIPQQSGFPDDVEWPIKPE